MFKKLVAMLAIAMLAMLVLVACGDDDDSESEDTGASDSTTTTGTMTSGGDVTEVDVTVEMVEMAFDPDAITVAAGEEVTMDLTNGGAVDHNFSVDGEDIDHTLSPGEGEIVTFTAPSEPGEYKIYCNIPGHEQAGMVGTLIVE